VEEDFTELNYSSHANSRTRKKKAKIVLTSLRALSHLLPCRTPLHSEGNDAPRNYWLSAVGMGGNYHQ